MDSAQSDDHYSLCSRPSEYQVGDDQTGNCVTHEDVKLGDEQEVNRAVEKQQQHAADIGSRPALVAAVCGTQLECKTHAENEGQQRQEFSLAECGNHAFRKGLGCAGVERTEQAIDVGEQPYVGPQGAQDGDAPDNVQRGNAG